MNNAQTVLIIVIVSLTFLLMVVGVQVFMIITDLRKSIKRLNSILEDAVLGGGLIKPEKLTGILEMIRKRRSLETVEKGNSN
ncbi:hypothetical protein A3D00_02480 [Candidatus Woesebacteria bacterium RIFCSPHIGHO2_02_FULL_38_9]|uniref:Uncharacterized protein n=1 Tax=Candidatus Woesebacteria bacterium RIFCSPHIGHO2_01_FULL_39_28 TaxID=1802496 RepID=A0A1F7YHH5_9BACT|nr:MAG: hypothetical protein A2627_05430 [Candidatus Woesebacteria bacterium RIFCSPHIGHO2_01_FULL_39_28]OGM34639.1 MAG: hypothetical protein A3D00_02480 [Candidatus Woesebacteria bacterium RIFCSPHIGHO2_02_FULL_38_9]OGM58219.1 MAG: hypothetical protein A3A50_04385 [Candidatus Woesebacteria bacterium RIFCSPLOWO2_01_FULL_38_20]